MKIIIITEENHGDIGVATTMKAAFQFLIDHDWLTTALCFRDETTGVWSTLGDVLESKGIEPTKQNLLAWAMEYANDWSMWYGVFYFHEETLYEEEDWE